MIPHLNGAATLLRRRLHTPPPSLAIRKFLIEMFCYFFSITALTHGPSLAFHDSSHIFDFPGLNTYLQNGTVLGTSQEAFAAVFQLARYLSQSQSDRDPESPTLLTTAQALQTSRPPFQTHPSMSPGTLNDGVTFELHRLACLIHLTQVTSPTTPTLAPSIQAMVASFIAYLAALPLESPSDGFLCWPLVIVGVHAVDRLHQIAIAARLKAIYNRFRSEIFSRNLAFLKGWWRGGRGAGGGGVGEYPVLLA
ncbi:fungal-specific transcription factor domain-containing protein [Aspergillus varians]